MKKVITSAALKTLAVALSLIILILSVLALFAPLKLAKLSRDAGGYNLAASFTIIEYNRNKSLSTLSQIVEYSIAAKKYKRIEKYAGILTEHSEFTEFCRQKDSAINGGYILSSYQQYIYGWLVTSMYMVKKPQHAFDTAKSVTKAKNSTDVYTQNNAMTYLVDIICEMRDEHYARQVLNYLESLYSEIDGKEYNDDEVERQVIATKARLTSDRQRLINFINKD